jgi:phosphoglucomutase
MTVCPYVAPPTRTTRVLVRIAIRGSGTEPKIKYYLFAEQRPNESKFTADELASIKQKVGARLKELWQWLRNDAMARSRG